MSNIKKKMGKKRSMITLHLCALALSCTLFLFAPLEQFMLNQTEMWFGIGKIVPWSIATFALFPAVIGLIGYFLPAKARRALCALVLSLAVCFYLQGNFINANYGELDGREVQWSEYTLYGVVDTVVWLIIIAGTFVLAFKKKKLFRTVARFASALMLCMQLVTLGTVLLTHPMENKEQTWIVSDRDQFTLGENENTIVFVVDACDTTYIPQILSEDADAMEEFGGFTYFSDYAGSYSKTKMGFLYLMTQKWYENDQKVEDFISDSYADVPLYTTLKDAGWGIRLYTSETYMSEKMVGVADNVIHTKLTVGDPVGLWGKMLEFVSFRYMPHVLKPLFVFYSGEFGFYKAAADGEAPYYKDNFAYMERYDERGLTVGGAENALVIYHINGSHLPCNMDEYGNNVGSWNTTEVEQTKGVFRFLGRYFADMKALGLYDKANIIITADHGRFDQGPSSPVMLIKPAGSAGELQENRAMASVSELHATILELCGFEADGDTFFDIAEDEERVRRYLYYPTTRSNGGTLPPLEEYHVERNQQFVPTGVVLEGGAGNIRK